MRPEFLTPDGELTAKVLCDSLLLVNVRAPLDVVERWTHLERVLVYDWVWREHIRASDGSIRRRPRPSLVIAVWGG